MAGNERESLFKYHKQGLDYATSDVTDSGDVATGKGIITSQLGVWVTMKITWAGGGAFLPGIPIRSVNNAFVLQLFGPYPVTIEPHYK